MRKVTLWLALLAVLALTVFPATAQDEGEGTIYDRILLSTEQETPDFTVILAALEVADPAFLELAQDEDAVFTLFAPTDTAFEVYLERNDLSAEELLADTDAVNELLAYHTLGLDFYGEDLGLLTDGFVGTGLPNAAILISTIEDTPFVDQAQVLQSNVLADNGVIHVIDTVLVPPPTARPEAADDLPSIADVLTEAGADGEEFTILLEAVNNADPLVLSLLAGEAGGQFTVFAPTDAAFQDALDTLDLSAEEVLGDPTLLTLLLANHVMLGNLDDSGLSFYAEQLAMGPDTEEDADMLLPAFATLFPASLLSFDPLEGTIGGAGLVETNIRASNGVVHVIDAVLLPDFAGIGFTLPGPDGGA